MTEVVAEFVIRRVQDPQTLCVLVELACGVVLILDENIPATTVLAVALLAVPVVYEGTLHEAHVLVGGTESAHLPLLEQLDIVGMDLIRD